MIATGRDRGSFWLRLKMIFTLARYRSQASGVKPASDIIKRRPHRTRAFFEMP